MLAAELANKVLGRPATAKPAASLLPTLEKHLQAYPEDTEFLVEAAPGTYGVVTCMENACYIDIELTADPSKSDYGKSDGFGSLDKYHEHIKSFSAHRKARDDRVAQTSTIKQKAAAEQEDRKPVIKDRKPNIGLPASSGSSSSKSRDNQATNSKPFITSYAPDRKPSLALLATLDKYSGSPASGKGKSIKRSSSAGPALSDDDIMFGADKKRKLDVKPSTLAERDNGQAAPTPQPPAQNFDAREREIEAQIAHAKQTTNEIISRPQSSAASHQMYDRIDESNRTIGRLQLALEKIRRERNAYVDKWGKAALDGQVEPRPAVGADLERRIRALQAKIDDGAEQAAAWLKAINGTPRANSKESTDYIDNWHKAHEELQRDRQALVRQRDLIAGGNDADVGGTGWHALPDGGYGRNGGPADRNLMMQDVMDLGAGLFGRGRASNSDDGLGAAGDALAHFTGSQDDLHDLLKLAAEGTDFEGNATVDEAAADLDLKSQADCIPGMVVSLMAHQLIGVAWMLKAENGKNFGGILADEMGLGKTVQTIATMCKNPSLDPREKTTLIVAPLALLEQWKDEIEEKCKPDQFSILVYHGEGKKGINKVAQLLKYDVVITTYHTLAMDYPDEESALKRAQKEVRKAKLAGDYTAAVDDFLDLSEPGLLLSATWYRVILDEAQYIRNRSTKISRSVAALDSLFRWCLTGTPVTNSLADLFPLLRFLQIKPMYNWKDFRETIYQFEKKDPKRAGQKAQHVLRSCMIRRRKDTKLDGKELVSLPAKNLHLLDLQFSPEEREIYDFVERRAQAKFNKYLRAGTVLKNYAHVLVMLLRLRQVCFHPCLISNGYDEFQLETKADEIAQNEIQRAKDVLGKDAVSKLRAERLQVAVAMSQAEQEDSDEAVDVDECPICMEDVSAGEGGGVVTRCSHIFCRSCVQEVLAKALPDDDPENAKRYKGDERPCPSCRGPISDTFIFALSAFEPADEEVLASAERDVDMDDLLGGKGKGKDEADDLNGFIVPDGQEDDSDEEEDLPVLKVKVQPNRPIVQDSDDEDEPIVSTAPAKDKGKGKAREEESSSSRGRKSKKKTELPEWQSKQEPSTKMKWALEELNRCREECPDDKTIIISTFTSALDIMDDMLTEHGYRTTRYQGDMNRSERDLSVRAFKKSNKVTIMLMSLTAGGVGLNLTRSNRVISLDLAWSSAVEDQAFSRCHRIGQTKVVEISRLTINNSVEQRLLDIQKRKQALADHSMGEGTGERVKRLSVGELARLFGLNARGERL